METKSKTIELIRSLENRLGFPPDSLLNACMFETSGTLSPSIQNLKTSATGLIQFMPSTALNLGISVSALKTMTVAEQLIYVEKYLSPYKQKIKNSYDPLDVYLSIFFPVAIGKKDDYILSSSTLTPAIVARYNPVFDKNKDNKITKGEVREIYFKAVNNFRSKDGLQPLKKSNNYIQIAMFGLVGILILSLFNL